MTAKRSSLTQWYDLRPLRERVLLLLCVLIVLTFLVGMFVLQPFSQRTNVLRHELAELGNNLVELKSREIAVTTRKNFDPDQDNRRHLEILEQESANLQQDLNASIVNLVTPRDMPTLLKQLLTQQKKLHLSSLENLPPERIVLDQQAGSDEVGPALYRHRLRMEFSGDYLTLLRYLKQLQQLPRTLVWDEVDIETEVYPRATVRIQVSTLSLTEGWIGG